MPLELHHAHPWDLPAGEAIALQEKLRERVVIQLLELGAIKTVAGVDASYRGGQARAAAVVLGFPALEPLEQAVCQMPVSFPYVPGLLSFREAPVILEALSRLKTTPDVLIVDGHGLAHPRRFGLACHLGVLLELPSLGCAKSILIGEAAPPGEAPGDASELIWQGELLGMALRTRAFARPVYVSVGHRIDLPSAVRVVLACGSGYRSPEPTRLAHRLAAQ